MSKLVSIIMPSYNSGPFIGQAIESIQHQTYTDWELLISDDCSTDNTCNVVLFYASRDSRVKLFVLDINSGAATARNNSLEKASGRYIAFCDSDDMWYPHKLSRQITFMEEKGYAFTYTATHICNEVGEITGADYYCPGKVTLGDIKLGNHLSTSTVIYDVSVTGKVLMPELRKRQDWGLWYRVLVKVGEGHGLKEPLGVYRDRSGSLSANKGSLLKYHTKVYRDVMDFGKIKAFLSLLFLNVPFLVYKTLYRKVALRSRGLQTVN